jgi:hypothetical protein
VFVTTVDPNGDPRPGPEGCSNPSNDGLYTLYQGWAEWGGQIPPIPTGAYTITAQDSAGHTSTPVTATLVEWPPVQNITYPADESVIAETVPVFTWEAVPDAQSFEVQVLEQGPDGYSIVWWLYYVPGDATSVPYNDDGMATAPQLTPGKHYELRVSAWHPDQEPSDQASVMPVTQCIVRFWVEPKFVGFLQPINNDGSSIFKLGSTVPVKFQLLNADGSYESDATATLKVAFVDQGIVGDYLEAVSTAAPDRGNTFRYDPAANQYIFNLGTRYLRHGTGTYSLQVTINGVVMKEVLISLN